jgi:hypothetical protein
LLGNDCETIKYTTVLLSNGFANKHVRTATNGNNNKETVFSVRSVLTCYKQDRWSNALAVRLSPTGKNVSTEAEDIAGIRPKATTEVIENLEDFICVVVNRDLWSMYFSETVVIICNHVL